MSDEKRNGRVIAFYMSHDEIDALQEEADRREITRNKAAREAVRDYVGSSLRAG